MTKKKVKSKGQETVNLTDLAKEIVRLGIITNIDREEEKEVKIIYDKSQDQFAIKIPRAISRELKLNSKKDKFKFRFSVDKDLKFTLKGDLIRG